MASHVQLQSSISKTSYAYFLQYLTVLKTPATYIRVMMVVSDSNGVGIFISLYADVRNALCLIDNFITAQNLI